MIPKRIPIDLLYHKLGKVDLWWTYLDAISTPVKYEIKLRMTLLIPHMFYNMDFKSHLIYAP